MTLIELAERCEQATGPDRNLDTAIFWWRSSDSCVLDYTASLDAAMTLVPEGWGRRQWSEAGKRDIARLWCDGHDVIASGSTPALALCAAALRARAA